MAMRIYTKKTLYMVSDVSFYNTYIEESYEWSLFGCMKCILHSTNKVQCKVYGLDINMFRRNSYVIDTLLPTIYTA